MRVFVAGSTGNLGTKLIGHLAASAWCSGVVAADNRPAAMASGGKVHNVVADLTDPADRRWRDVLAGCDALVHFATRNPLPACTWDEATESLAMTATLLDAVAASGVRRFVFASSNHVMGGYKDKPLADAVGPGELTEETEPSPGTRIVVNGVPTRRNAYATSKLYGENLVLAKCRASDGRMSGVSARIGWCQPGENDPATINALAIPLPVAEALAANAANPADIAWFRGMWLSNGDFVHLMERSIRADAAAWPTPAVVVNGTSRNTGSVWSLTAGWRLIGYDPQDDWTRRL
jgi:nucleoside-diphosphate-sugar epimerase